MRHNAEAAHERLAKENELETLRAELATVRSQMTAAPMTSSDALHNGTWTGIKDTDGRKYYANDVTGESAWELPVDRRAALKKHFSTSVEQLGGCLPEVPRVFDSCPIS